MAIRSVYSHILLHMISFILLFFSPPCCAYGGNLDALLKLKNAMNIGPETSALLQDWVPFTHYCSFSGVSCDQQSRVVALHLSNMPLFGSIPSKIGLLNHLVNLSIGSNNLTGRLPVEMANLTSLKHLNISNNLFSGKFPGEIALRMSELEVLDAYNNNFTGQLPLELASCTKLKHLQLGGNYFTGNIPVNYSNILSLEYLGLNANSLTGDIPASLARLENLKELYLGYYNSYDGGIPPELGSLTWLRVLDMASCNLTGQIPTSLSLLKHLQSLFLQVNRLSGFIHPELSGMVSLVTLDLSINELTGEIPESFSGLENIALINLYRNNLYGPIPKFIGDLPYLEVLQLWVNNFTFELPESLGRNGRLTDLDVSGNHLTGSIPRDLCKGGKLRILILMDNHFFGPIPEELGRCKSLFKIRMMKNTISGTIPVGIFNLPNVIMIEVDENCLSGKLPTEMSGGSLAIITLSGNQISGEIPREIGNLKNLRTLSLAKNQFSGEIPKEIFNLEMLSKLNLSINNLGGEIPASVWNCSLSLTSLDFSRNNLVGEIPRWIVKLNLIYLLNFSRNQLTGQIPDEITYVMSLTSVDLSYNNFTGAIPTGSPFLAITSFEGNPYLCQNISCSPLISQTARSHNAFGSSMLALIIIGPVLVFLLIMLLVFVLTKVYRILKIRKIEESRCWRLTMFQQLDLKVDDVLQCLKNENIIGKGGAGIVYRGTMPSGLDVAIKQLLGPSTGRRDHGFSAEIKTLGLIKHRNIVRLLGYMSNKDSNLLLYEYMPNGSLGKLLHRPNAGQLQWDRRYKIAVETAKGLCYLHHDCLPLIIHRDVKSYNILLDSNFEAHVADFGLAKYFQGASDCMSSLAGSFGYIAPEYGYTLKVDEKIDVYSFGVVLLELITGRKPVMNLEDDVNLVSWVRKTTSAIPKPSLLAVVDPKLSEYPSASVVHLFKIAMMCVENDSRARPTMRDVVNLLTNPPPASLCTISIN